MGCGNLLIGTLVIMILIITGISHTLEEFPLSSCFGYGTGNEAENSPLELKWKIGNRQEFHSIQSETKMFDFSSALICCAI